MSGKYCVKKKSGSMCFGFDGWSDARMAQALAVSTLKLTKEKGVVEVCGPIFGCNPEFSWDGKRLRPMLTLKTFGKLAGFGLAVGATVALVMKAVD